MSSHNRELITSNTIRPVRLSGRRRVDTAPLSLRMTAELLSAIDDWRRTQPDLPIRTEAIRRLIVQALKTTSRRKAG